ncbi:MAG: hypothetical protein KGZ58_08895 [Ignavibacteriales bacterium]|nr:hypothetical protein [Ignavibacteriales bacterium]
MPTQTIIEFFLYITPGFLAFQIYRSLYPAKPASDFSQITWSVIYSVFIYVGVLWVDDTYLNKSLKSPSTEFPNIYFAFALYVSAVALGLTVSLFHFTRFKIATKFNSLRRLLPDPQSIWAKVNQSTNRDWAVVYLNDNSIYLGYIAEYTFDPSADDQDFLLSDAKRVDESLREIYTVDGIGVYLNTRNVSRIEFLKSQNN